jgi:hypothetical protein
MSEHVFNFQLENIQSNGDGTADSTRTKHYRKLSQHLYLSLRLIHSRRNIDFPIPLGAILSISTSQIQPVGVINSSKDMKDNIGFIMSQIVVYVAQILQKNSFIIGIIEQLLPFLSGICLDFSDYVDDLAQLAGDSQVSDQPDHLFLFFSYLKSFCIKNSDKTDDSLDNNNFNNNSNRNNTNTQNNSITISLRRNMRNLCLLLQQYIFSYLTNPIKPGNEIKNDEFLNHFGPNASQAEDIHKGDQLDELNMNLNVYQQHSFDHFQQGPEMSTPLVRNLPGLAKTDVSMLSIHNNKNKQNNNNNNNNNNNIMTSFWIAFNNLNFPPSQQNHQIRLSFKSTYEANYWLLTIRLMLASIYSPILCLYLFKMIMDKNTIISVPISQTPTKEGLFKFSQPNFHNNSNHNNHNNHNNQNHQNNNNNQNHQNNNNSNVKILTNVSNPISHTHPLFSLPSTPVKSISGFDAGDIFLQNNKNNNHTPQSTSIPLFHPQSLSFSSQRPQPLPQNLANLHIDFETDQDDEIIQPTPVGAGSLALSLQSGKGFGF